MPGKKKINSNLSISGNGPCNFDKTNGSRASNEETPWCRRLCCPLCVYLSIVWWKTINNGGLRRSTDHNHRSSAVAVIDAVHCEIGGVRIFRFEHTHNNRRCVIHLHLTGTTKTCNMFTAMKDRLSNLQACSASSLNVGESGNATIGSSSRQEDQRKTSLDHNPESEMEAVFDVVQDIRRDVQLIHSDVQRLGEHYSQVHADLPNSATFQQDTNVITAGIKTQAEDILTRLRQMEKHVKELENKYGTNTAIYRIARTQYTDMSIGFRDVMMEYNKTEMGHKETCKLHFQRQMEIVGRVVTDDQIEQMLENNQWNVFTENTSIEDRTPRSALNQIESRHMELLELERRIRSIHEVFLDIAMLVEEQAPMVDYILNNVQKTDADMNAMLGKLKNAKKYNKKHPFKRLFYRK